MTRFTTAELRGYQQVCNAGGAMLAVASDQRGAMRAVLTADPTERAAISDDDLGRVKSDIVRYLASQASAVLLDPTCAVPDVVRNGTLPRDVALLIGLDASGFDIDASGYRLSRLIKEVGARQVRELGGTAGKIMVYLRADQAGANQHNIDILKHCVADFAQEDLLLIVEFLTYPLDGEDEATYAAKIPELVEGGVRIALECGAKVLKVPFPGNARSCANITEMAGDVPWAILSAGVDHDTFLEQVRVAVGNGASGVIAGRALWKDCISLDSSVTRDRLTNLAVPRLREIYAVLDECLQTRANSNSAMV
jgi:tagatose-1,6-bisphosphate aldolase